MKVPIVVAAFGTTTRALETYSIIDKGLKDRFHGHEIVWAYSSRMVKDFIKQRRNIDLKHPHQVLAELKAKGHSWAVVQSLHLLNGHEFYRLVEEARQCDIRTSMGLPLLSNPEDLVDVVEGLGKCFSNFENEVVVLIGHGTDHPTWSSYLALHHMFRERFGPRVFVSVVEGYPTREQIIEAVKESGCRKVRLIPFMIVAGTHLEEDIAGDDDSWKMAFEQEQISVAIEKKGLAFYPCIIDTFCRHIQEALEIIPQTCEKWMPQCQICKTSLDN
jgi:sirohydrochlorin cobaltochelatase